MKANLLRLLFSVLLVLAIAAASRIWVGRPASHSVLRLSWSLVGVQITEELTEAELAELPVHMRPSDGVLKSKPVPYHLTVILDDRVVVDRTVSAAGLRGDRPMYVHEDFEMEAGSHDVTVRFEPKQDVQDAVRYGLKQTIEMRSGRIVTLELEKGTPLLVIRRD